MKSQTFNSVWDAIIDDPRERANLKMRADLMANISQIVKKNHWTQTQASKHCGISQPRMNNLLKGEINKFSLDALVNIHANLGKSIQLSFSDMAIS